MYVNNVCSLTSIVETVVNLKHLFYYSILFESYCLLYYSDLIKSVLFSVAQI